MVAKLNVFFFKHQCLPWIENSFSGELSSQRRKTDCMEERLKKVLLKIFAQFNHQQLARHCVLDFLVHPLLYAYFKSSIFI